MLIKYYKYKTNINFIYPTEDTVTNEGNKLNYYCNQLSSKLIHFNNLFSSDFKLGLRKSCVLFWFVRLRSPHKHLGEQKLVNAAQRLSLIK